MHEWEKILWVPPEFRDWDNSILNEGAFDKVV